MAKILLVDDDDNMREMIRMILKDQHEITEMDDGQHVVDEVKRQKYDLLIIDMIMPTTDGTHAIAEVVNYYPTMKILAMSGGYDNNLTKEDLLMAAEKLGATAMLPKPFSMETFVSTIKKLGI